jgi:uncharacterized protein (TIGR00251 family)
MKLRVRLTPKSSSDRILGWQDGILRVAVSAAPEKGKANRALVDFLARGLGLPRSCVRLIKGETSRDKVLEIDRLNEPELARRLSPIG